MNRVIFKLVIASLSLVVPACAARSSSTSFDDTPTGRTSVTVEVRNQNFYPAKIYAYRSGIRRRLGEVQAHQTTSFSFEWSLSDIRFLIDFLAAGCIISHRMGPVCTIMVGRLDDWLKGVANQEGIVTDPAHLDWAGVAVMKKTYRLFRDQGYTARLLAAATRHHMHWSEFIGADMVVTLTHQWQKRFNASDVEVVSRIDKPVDPEIIDGLLDKFVDFRRAYEQQGLAQSEFDGFGPTRKTLYGFTGACQDLVRVIRGYLLPGVE